MNKYEDLLGSWYSKLAPFLKSEEFKNILRTLKEESSQTEIFPKPEKIFNCFKYCPFDKTMVVFLGANPYYNFSKSDGLLFSHEGPGTNKLLKLVFNAIEDNYDKKLKNTDSNLERWANQGVLLLSLDLTFCYGKRGSHIKLWGPFLRAVISALHEHHPGVIYVLFGQDSLKYADLIDPTSNDIFCVEHPAKSLILGRNWKHKNVFLYLDRVTNMIFNRKINWYA